MLYLQPIPDNPLLNLNLTSADPAALGFMVFGVVLAILLGHACYTDIFCNKIIKNQVNAAIFVICLVAAPFIFASIGSHLLVVLAVYIFLFFIALLGAAKMGDIKLYAGLTVVLGLAGIYMIFLSWLVIIIYSIPIMIKTVQENKRSGVKAKRGQRLGSAPGAPGIVIAFYLTSLAIGLDAQLVGIAAVISLLSVAGFYFLIGPKEPEEELGDSSEEKIDPSPEAATA